ncbi:MAG: 30S ribosomal protein S6 [Alphaproteobacteria bacterium]|nr:30S ribosomal protein S6 [Alphaproteobacteria bacterium]
MPIYETVFMTRPDLTEMQVKDMTEQFSKIVKDLGGKILKTENWGLRTLAYRINKNRKAHYVLLETDAPPAAVIELERNLRLHEDVLRSLTVRREEASKEQSAILEKSSRYDEKEAA